MIERGREAVLLLTGGGVRTGYKIAGSNTQSVGKRLLGNDLIGVFCR